MEPLEVESNARPVDQKAEVRIQDLKKVLPFDSCSVQLLIVLSHIKTETYGIIIVNSIVEDSSFTPPPPSSIIRSSVI